MKIQTVQMLPFRTLIDKLGVRRVPLVNGNLSIPRMDSTSAISWGGEETVGDTTQPVFGEVNMHAKKLFAKTAITNTLIRSSGVDVEGWIAEDLFRKARIGLDEALLHGTGSQYQPLGLENVTGVQTTGGATTAIGVDMPNDLEALLGQANVPMENVKWLLSPKGKSWLKSTKFTAGPFAWATEMATQKTLNGFDFLTSTTVKYTKATAAIELYKSEDIQMKGWVSVQDDRTRDAHLLMDGVVVPINDKFEVPATSQSEGAFMEYAGDPSAPVGQVANCRCTVMPVVMI